MQCEKLLDRKIKVRKMKREYEKHARRLLRHTELDATLRAKIGLKLVTFTTITRERF